MNTKQLLKKNNITANVLTKWSDMRCKFWPGEVARQNTKHSQKGLVIAVSTVDGESIRSSNRGWTTYYMVHKDGSVKGYRSNELVKV